LICRSVVFLQRSSMRLTNEQRKIISPLNSYRSYSTTNACPAEGVRKVLKHHAFDDEHISNIVERFRDSNLHLSPAKVESIHSVIEFWNENLKPVRQNLPIKVDSEYDYTKMTVNQVLSQVEPDLLLINPEAMSKRIEELKVVGFLSGNSDLWRVFVSAPRGYFLQDWSEFLRKFYYIEHRVMPWMVDKKDKHLITTHPLIKFPKVFECSYDHIKARHLFAHRTGMKAISVSNKLESKSSLINIGRLMLSNNYDYLQYVAPDCTQEEYLVFEQHIADTEDEDDKIMLDLCELAKSQSIAQEELKLKEVLRSRNRRLNIKKIDFMA